MKNTYDAKSGLSSRSHLTDHLSVAPLRYFLVFYYPKRFGMLRGYYLISIFSFGSLSNCHAAAVLDWLSVDKMKSKIRENAGYTMIELWFHL